MTVNTRDVREPENIGNQMVGTSREEGSQKFRDSRKFRKSGYRFLNYSAVYNSLQNM